ncbi:MAG: uroporphyrinogen decarboxylase family protein [bacterium]
MNSRERVLTACAFERPDRIPRFDGFWEYPESWQERFGSPDGLSDISIWVPDETSNPLGARLIKEEGGDYYYVDSWGHTKRSRPGAYFEEYIKALIPLGVDPDSVQFDSPTLDARYLGGCKDEPEFNKKLDEGKSKWCVFGKTGGPYLRTTFVRGEAQFLIDIAEDPELAKALADKVGDHITAVGVEEIKRWKLQDTGIFIYDDMAYNDNPFFSPKSFEKVFLPAYRRMIKAYKEAGAKYVFLHSDGNIRPILDMLIDAGIEGLNPLERRAKMDPFEIRKTYPKVVLTGGMCNSHTLINGPIEKIVREAKELIDLGKDGGVVIGTHSVSPEVPIEHFAAYHETCLTYGNFE